MAMGAADQPFKLTEEETYYQTMSDQMAKTLADESMAIEAERLQLRQTYLERFRKVLPEKQAARYSQLKNKVHAAVSYEFAADIPLVK